MVALMVGNRDNKQMIGQRQQDTMVFRICGSSCEVVLFRNSRMNHHSINTMSRP